jgi:hypothetical protein
MLASPAASFFVAGQVDQGVASTEPATADTAIELPTTTPRLPDTDEATARTYFDSTPNPFITYAASSRQRNRDGDRLLDEVVAQASAHRVNPRMRPWLQRRGERRRPKWTMVGRRDIRRARPQSETSMPLKRPRWYDGKRNSATAKVKATWSDHSGRPRTWVSSRRVALSNEWLVPRAWPSGDHGPGRRSARGEQVWSRRPARTVHGSLAG